MTASWQPNDPLARARKVGLRVDSAHSIGVPRMAALGASRPLRRIPAIVSFLNPQPALSLVGGNRSSCPIPDLHAPHAASFQPGDRVFDGRQQATEGQSDGCRTRTALRAPELPLVDGKRISQRTEILSGWAGSEGRKSPVASVTARLVTAASPAAIADGRCHLFCWRSLG